MKTKNIFNRDESIKAQRDYCERKNKPYFIPWGARCVCGFEIFGEKGYTVEQAGKQLITGCPWCHRSFLD